MNLRLPTNLRPPSEEQLHDSKALRQYIRENIPDGMEGALDGLQAEMLVRVGDCTFDDLDEFVVFLEDDFQDLGGIGLPQSWADWGKGSGLVSGKAGDVWSAVDNGRRNSTQASEVKQEIETSDSENLSPAEIVYYQGLNPFDSPRLAIERDLENILQDEEAFLSFVEINHLENYFFYTDPMDGRACYDVPATVNDLYATIGISEGDFGPDTSVSSARSLVQSVEGDGELSSHYPVTRHATAGQAFEDLKSFETDYYRRCENHYRTLLARPGGDPSMLTKSLFAIYLINRAQGGKWKAEQAVIHHLERFGADLGGNNQLAEVYAVIGAFHRAVKNHEDGFGDFHINVQSDNSWSDSNSLSMYGLFDDDETQALFGEFYQHEHTKAILNELEYSDDYAEMRDLFESAADVAHEALEESMGRDSPEDFYAILENFPTSQARELLYRRLGVNEELLTLAEGYEGTRIPAGVDPTTWSVAQAIISSKQEYESNETWRTVGKFSLFIGVPLLVGATGGAGAGIVAGIVAGGLVGASEIHEIDHDLMMAEANVYADLEAEGYGSERYVKALKTEQSYTYIAAGGYVVAGAVGGGMAFKGGQAGGKIFWQIVKEHFLYGAKVGMVDALGTTGIDGRVVDVDHNREMTGTLLGLEEGTEAYEESYGYSDVAMTLGFAAVLGGLVGGSFETLGPVAQRLLSRLKNAYIVPRPQHDPGSPGRIDLVDVQGRSIEEARVVGMDEGTGEVTVLLEIDGEQVEVQMLVRTDEPPVQIQEGPTKPKTEVVAHYLDDVDDVDLLEVHEHEPQADDDLTLPHPEPQDEVPLVPTDGDDEVVFAMDGDDIGLPEPEAEIERVPSNVFPEEFEVTLTDELEVTEPTVSMSPDARARGTDVDLDSIEETLETTAATVENTMSRQDGVNPETTRPSLPSEQMVREAPVRIDDTQPMVATTRSRRPVEIHTSVAVEIRRIEEMPLSRLQNHIYRTQGQVTRFARHEPGRRLIEVRPVDSPDGVPGTYDEFMAVVDAYRRRVDDLVAQGKMEGMEDNVRAEISRLERYINSSRPAPTADPMIGVEWEIDEAELEPVRAFHDGLTEPDVVRRTARERSRRLIDEIRHTRRYFKKIESGQHTIQPGDETAYQDIVADYRSRIEEIRELGLNVEDLERQLVSLDESFNRAYRSLPQVEGARVMVGRGR